MGVGVGGGSCCPLCCEQHCVDILICVFPSDHQAWQAHHAEDEEHEYISIQKPLFDVHSFTSKQVWVDRVVFASACWLACSSLIGEDSQQCHDVPDSDLHVELAINCF